jgi:hypothetical protein
MNRDIPSATTPSAAGSGTAAVAWLEVIVVVVANKAAVT